jgi:hypothetical protein
LRKEDTSTRRFLHEEFSIRIPVNFCFEVLSLVDKITKQVGVRGYMHSKNSLGYFLEGSNACGCPTFTGSFAQLHATMSLMPEEIISVYDSRLSSAETRGQCKRWSLRVCAPSAATLERLAAACRQCRENPGTLGVSFDSNAYFAVKTIADMKVMLEYLASGTPCPATFEFKLIELTYPKGVF